MRNLTGTYRPNPEHRLDEPTREGDSLLGVMPMMRVEAPKRSGHSGTGTHDGTVHIHRQAWQLETGDGLQHHLLIELDDQRQRAMGKLLQPVHHRTRRRQPDQTAKTADQRIAREGAQILQAARADVEAARNQQGQLPPYSLPTAAQAARSRLVDPIRRTYRRPAPGCRTRSDPAGRPPVARSRSEGPPVWGK